VGGGLWSYDPIPAHRASKSFAKTAKTPFLVFNDLFEMAIAGIT
jgi:hypothetical protein